MYYMKMSLTDIENCDASELSYIHNWLSEKLEEKSKKE